MLEGRAKRAREPTESYEGRDHHGEGGDEETG
jgi:hypothetical protein